MYPPSLGLPPAPPRALAALVLAAALLAGCAEAGREPPAWFGIIRLGIASESTYVPGGTRPILDSNSLPIANFPASRVLFGAARPAGGPAHCTLEMLEDTEASMQLAKLELPGDSADPVSWTDFELQLPAVESGELRFGCIGDDLEEQPVKWSQPIAIPDALGSSPGPLIVVMSLDTLRADHTPGFGGDPKTSPNLDRIVRGGMRFTNAQAEGTWTLPSHFSLMTSRLLGLAGTPRHPVTLATALARAGYATISSTGGGWMSAKMGFAVGFDQHSDEFVKNQDIGRMVGEGIGWLDRLGDAPTFLFLHTYAVHQAPPNFKRSFAGKQRRLPPEAALREDAGFYRSLVREADVALAPLVARIEREALRRPVLFVLVSDHGQAFGEHDNYGHGPAGLMTTLHDEIVRIPIIVWAPGRVEPGTKSTWPISLVDVAPTLLSAAGVPVPEDMRGTNLWPLWSGTGEAPAQAAGAVSHLECQWSYRSDRHKLIVRIAPDGADRFQLYDLSADPNESENLASAMPELVAQLSDALREELTALGVERGAYSDGYAFPRGGRRFPNDPARCNEDLGTSEDAVHGQYPRFSKRLREQLEALGYAE